MLGMAIFYCQADFPKFVLKLLAVSAAFVPSSARRPQWVDERPGQRLLSDMRPVDIQHVGNELALRWDDGSESFIPLEKLRRSCPCAGCKGEVDIMGNLHIGPEVALPPTAFDLVRFTIVGTYAIQPVWADGHTSGLFSFDYLR